MDKDDDRRDDDESKKNPWFIFILLLLIVLILFLLIQGSKKESSTQIIPSITPQTTQQISQSISPTSAQVTNAPCSSVPFYCLINGGGVCNSPTTCPVKKTPVCNQVPVPSSKVVIHFDLSKWDIRSVDKPALNNFAEIMKKDPLATITIDGYTDNVPFIPGTSGPVTNNQQLSDARAQEAENYLKGKGVTAPNYDISGHGASHFVAPNNPQTGNILNRRDEITVTSNAPLCANLTPTPTKPINTPTPTVTPTPAFCMDNSTDSFQGGYTFSPPVTSTKQLTVSSQWKVVNATCKINEQGFTTWTGIKTNDMNIQAGSYALCSSNGSVQYFPWTMAFPGPMANPPNVDTISPGDSMSASITMTKPGSFIINLTNITKVWSYQVNAQDAGFTALSPNSGQIYMEDEPVQDTQVPQQLTQFSPDANFTSSQFSINGSSPAPLAKAPGLLCHNIIRNKSVLEQTSNITLGNFDETWKQP